MVAQADHCSLRVAVCDLTAYERFLKEHLTRVAGVASIESSFALDRVKYSTALPLRLRTPFRPDPIRSRLPSSTGRRSAHVVP